MKAKELLEKLDDQAIKELAELVKAILDEDPEFDWEEAVSESRIDEFLPNLRKAVSKVVSGAKKIKIGGTGRAERKADKSAKKTQRMKIALQIQQLKDKIAKLVLAKKKL